MASEIWCKACGAKCMTTDNYCPLCHASLRAQDHSGELPLYGIPIEQWYKFIGKNADKYVHSFTKHKDKAYYIDFNIAAWFFPTYWFAYRRMFGKAVLLQMFSAIISSLLIIGTASNTNPFGFLGLAYLISYSLPILVGLFANSIYRQHVKEKLSRPVPDMNAGGTSVGAVIGWYFLNNALTNAVSFTVFTVGSAILTNV